MAFIEGTKIFTDSGFKPIENLSGHDKVLVRNFLGDAEFIQPFALKKRKYSGKITEIGGINWKLSTTPDHIIAYDHDEAVKGVNFVYEKAKNVKVDYDNRIYRKFKYMNGDTYKREMIVVFDEFGKSYHTISDRDWYVLCAFVLLRGYLEPAGKRRALNIYLDKDKKDDELAILSDIFDRLGVVWSVFPSKTKRHWVLRVNPKNTLCSRLSARLGSIKRKKMCVPDKMIYNASKELVKVFIETIITVSKKRETSPDNYQFSTNNKSLIDSLELMGTIWGYGMATKVAVKKGVDQGRGALSKTVYGLMINNLPQTYSPRYNNSLDYQGYVYEIDLFDGQVYAKNGSMPVWVNPK